MEWKNKIGEEDCADELEKMILDAIKAGFLSNDEISEDCTDYIEENYPDECEKIPEEDFLEIIETLRSEFQNTENQENFLKLDSVFTSLRKQGIVALHCAGYTQSEGFEDCNETASELHEKGERAAGCCFYTEQDLQHILDEDGALFYFSFGNYFENPTAEEIGQTIADAFKAAGFCVQWDGTAKTKIGIRDFKWDKHYSDDE